VFELADYVIIFAVMLIFSLLMQRKLSNTFKIIEEDIVKIKKELAKLEKKLNKLSKRIDALAREVIG